MAVSLAARIAPNWTSAAGALEGILQFFEMPLPRHGVMGLSGHAWHFCLGTRDGVRALPSGPADLDWDAAPANYSRTGLAWERFGARLTPGTDWTEMRAAAVEWATGHLDAGRPLIGWDFHLHEHAVVYGYDLERRGFLVDDLLSGDGGPFAPWEEWPGPLGVVELFASLGPSAVDPVEAVGGALSHALACLRGEDGPPEDPAQPRGAAGLDSWADAFDGEDVIDRAGNAYTLAILQAARSDGAAFLADLAAAIPELAVPLNVAERAFREETKALAPLLTLFPFPAGGHGNVDNPGLRRGAAMALRRAAQHERTAAAALAETIDALDPSS